MGPYDSEKYEEFASALSGATVEALGGIDAEVEKIEFLDRVFHSLLRNVVENDDYISHFPHSFQRDNGSVCISSPKTMADMLVSDVSLQMRADKLGISVSQLLRADEAVDKLLDKENARSGGDNGDIGTDGSGNEW